MSQRDAITASINWNVDVYTEVYTGWADAPTAPTAPTPDEYRQSLEAMYNYRLSVLGVKIWGKNPDSPSSPLCQVSLRQVGMAAWITNAIFLENRFLFTGNNACELRDLTLGAMNLNNLRDQVARALTQINQLSPTPLPTILPVNSTNAKALNNNILGVANSLLGNVAGLIPAAPTDPHAMENTFLTAGITRGNILRIFLHALRVISEVCSSNAEPPEGGAARARWVDLKHFNFVNNGFIIKADKITANLYRVTDEFKDVEFISSTVSTVFSKRNCYA
eukprot:gene10662-11825_t